MLLKIADLFQCEYGYILGEESYKYGSKLNTAVCESLGLSAEAVEALRSVTHRGLRRELEQRQQAISSFFTAPGFGMFIDCLVEAITISKELKSYTDNVVEQLVIRHGEDIVNKAVTYCSFSDAIPADTADDPKFQEIVSKLESAIDESLKWEYEQKVARYELREAFEQLIRRIQ